MTGIFLSKNMPSIAIPRKARSRKFAWPLLTALLIIFLTASFMLPVSSMDESVEQASTLSPQELRDAIGARIATLAAGTDSEDEENAATETPETIELSETASASDAMGGRVTVNFPSGWTATALDGAGTITLMGIEAGEVVSVTFLNPSIASALGDSPTEVLELQSASFNSVSGAEVSEITEILIGDYPAAMMTITIADMDTLYYAVLIEDGYAFVYGVGVDEAVLEAIAASITYSEE